MYIQAESLMYQIFRLFIFSFFMYILFSWIDKKIPILWLFRAFFKYIPLSMNFIIKIAVWSFKSCIFIIKSVAIVPIGFVTNIKLGKNKESGAYFLPPLKERKVLKPSHKGLLINGKEKRLSEKASFMHLLMVAPSGAGKTTKFIIPNTLSAKGSLLITDPSGEIFSTVSGELKQKGFDIKVVCPATPEISISYNPLSKISRQTDISEIAQVLVQSAGSDSKDSFWNNGAVECIEIVISLLLSVNNTKFINLPNVLYLLQNMTTPSFEILLAKYADDRLISQFKGLISGNETTYLSFISTAMTSLKSFNNPDMCQMFIDDEIEFDDLRRKKTALFIILPSEKMSYYSFVMNMLYSQAFQSFMKKIPSKDDLPIYCMLDEMGNTSIPNLDSVITTIRKYKVSLSCIIQSLSQLQSRYSVHTANTIINGGISNRLFLPGLDINTARVLSESIGKVRKTYTDSKEAEYERQYELLNPSEIIRMKDSEAILLSANNQPIKLKKMTPYYKHPFFSKAAKKKPETLNKRVSSPVEYIPLPEIGES